MKMSAKNILMLFFVSTFSLFLVAADDPSGVYHLDGPAVEKDALKQVRAEFEKSMTGQGEEAKAGLEQQWLVMEGEVKQMLKEMVITLRMEKDGTFQVDGHTGGEKMVSKGTWRQEGELFVFTTSETNGKPDSTPDVVSATIVDGILRMKPDKNTSFEFIMIKEKN